MYRDIPPGATVDDVIRGAEAFAKVRFPVLPGYQPWKPHTTSEKLKQMCLQFRGPELAAFHDVKHAFDPSGILNPGKAVPLLKRCAEWGGMHVRGGQLPRPDIPRF